MGDENLFSLQGKVALLTGASSGIGLHIAKVFARAGARVALAARRSDKIQAAVSEFLAAGYRACGVYLDVTDIKSIGPAFDSTERQFGASVDILFNNSG